MCIDYDSVFMYRHALLFLIATKTTGFIKKL